MDKRFVSQEINKDWNGKHEMKNKWPDYFLMSKISIILIGPMLTANKILVQSLTN